MHELLGVTILSLHGMYDDVSSSLPISMHLGRIGIPPSQKPGMPFPRGCIEVGGEDDTSSYIP
jgi:hypothetical protein